MRGLKIMTVIGLAFTLAMPLAAQKLKIVEKEYEKMDALRIDLILGDCRIETSPDTKIHIRLEHNYDTEFFEARFRERSNKLIIEEKFYGRNHNNEGHSRWEIQLPKGIEVDWKSATGDLVLKGVDGQYQGHSGTGSIEILNSKGEFELHSGTGNVEISNSQGEFEVHSGTGDVIIDKATGNFNGHSGTGDVEVSDISIEFDAEFHSGTGSAEVTAPKGSDYNLSLSSGTGSAVLDMSGMPLKGTFEMRCDERHGRIRCPVPFDNEKVIGQHDSQTLVKTFSKGGRTPQISISTGTGRAVLKN